VSAPVSLAAAPLGKGLSPLPGEPDAAFLAALGDAAGPDGEALATVAAVSPFLRHLMLADREGLAAILARPLEATVQSASRGEGETGAALRRGRAQVALAVALADLLGGASVATVTRALSDFADAAIDAALRAALADAHARGHITDADPETSGLIVLALGKLGAHELNYSSDVDLVVLLDPTHAEGRGLSAGRAVRLVQRMGQLLSARTADGYVFRVDFRLRPDPGSTPVVVSTPAAISYFQTRARAWERQAIIKARQVAGDRVAGARYLDRIEPSVWRRSYDFAAVDEMIATREEIARVKGAGSLTVPGHNVKLGRGGIREVEFFVQTLQRVAAGRDRHLRGRATVPMLRALSEAGWVEPATADELAAAYERLRKVEHRLQMVADEQTHTLPDAAGLPRIARMMREDDFEERMRGTLDTVHRHFASLADLCGQANPMLHGLRATATPSERAAAAIEEQFRGWADGLYQSLRTERARRLLADLKPVLTQAIAASADPEATLAALDGFFARLPAGVDLLSRLDLHRELVPVVVLIVSAAPRLAAELARRAHLLDVLIDPAFFGQLPDKTALRQALDTAVAAAPDYEGRLDAMRVFGQEQALLVNVRVLTGSIAGPDAGEATTRLAEVLVRKAFEVAEAEFAIRHGRLAGGAVVLLALGKFGSREMTATSDLDMVFLYDCAPDCGESDGEKPLSPGHYYTRLAQRFIAALAAPTARGTLYAVDLRLRPSGQAGPLATHIESFARYHEESAWVWEHLALTRARVIAGAPALGARIVEVIDRAVAHERERDNLAGQVADMRRRMAAQSERGLKHAAGGQVDIEFIVQFLQLCRGRRTGSTELPAALRELRDDGDLAPDAAETLLSAHALYQRLSQLFAIASDKALAVDEVPQALQRLMVRAGEAPDIEFLRADLAERQRAVRALFEAIVAPVAEEPAAPERPVA
jgi:glutamate-ammonia-ligase adenylyltransferase